MDMITLNDILSINKEKAAELYKVQGRQLPNQLNNLNGFIDSVRKSNQKVNYDSAGKYKNDMLIALEKALEDAKLSNLNGKKSIGKSLFEYDTDIIPTVDSSLMICCLLSQN
ncbi:hypothetical protein [Dielma fastidiosa]|uniref:Uncharacterized protein n=1 Tax=Dielma fastidiosa TaxID=1034346 RepID=A0AB35ULW8_9FIRM|nr:hypothetical protein [Dielma fastidiosa]MDY5167747.1 hypothetical protein [Dielma fastidiosa]